MALRSSPILKAVSDDDDEKKTEMMWERATYEALRGIWYDGTRQRISWK